MATTFYKPLSCFEPSFERFATVSQDGRLKIFDTRSGGVQQQLAEKDHLSTQYTAIAWGATTVRPSHHAHPTLSGDYLDINFEIFFSIVFNLGIQTLRYAHPLFFVWLFSVPGRGSDRAQQACQEAARFVSRQ
jgi:hypothetical protein